MKRGRTSHKKIAATAARFDAASRRGKISVERDADYYRAKLSSRLLSPRDRRFYERKLAECEARDAALARARALIDAERKAP